MRRKDGRGTNSRSLHAPWDPQDVAMADRCRCRSRWFNHRLCSLLRQCEGDYAIAAASGAAVLGAILVATPYLVVIAFLSLILEIAEGVYWTTNYLYDRLEENDEGGS